jgi:hypothetical protein
MKIIDHTPFSENGKISSANRVKGTLQFGVNWYAEMEAQLAVITRLEKLLDKKFTLIRNLTVGGSGVTLPLILVGPPGIYLIVVTNLRGMYQAKGDEWGTLNNGRFQPSNTNLLTRAQRMARGLQMQLEKQSLPGLPPVEGVVMASDPGLHIESTRPIVRVIMSDAVERFSASLLQGRPLLTPEAVAELADRIISPRFPTRASQPLRPAEIPPPAADVPAPGTSAEPAAPLFSNDDSTPINPADVQFAFDAAPRVEKFDFREPSKYPAEPPPRPAAARPRPTATGAPGAKKKKSKRILGMTSMQCGIIAVIFVVACACVAAIGVVLYMNPSILSSFLPQ